MHFFLIICLFCIYFITGGDRGERNNVIRKRQVVLMGFLLFVFAILRSYTVGTDIVRYFYGFYEALNMSIEEVVFYHSTGDPFFYIVNYYLGRVINTPYIMLVYVAAIVAFGFSYFAYHQKGNVLLFFMLFIGFRMYSFTLSGLRQGTAMGLIYLASVFLLQNKTKKYLLFTILAFLFHKTSILFLIAYPVMKWKNDRLFVVSIIGFAFFNLIFGNAVVSILATYLFNQMSGYVDTKNGMAFEGGSTFLIYVFIFIISSVYYQKLKKHDEVFISNYKLYSVGMFFSLIGQSFENVFRIAYYFIFFGMPIFSQFLGVFANCDRKKTAAFNMIICILMATQYLLLGPGADTEDYKFFWEEEYIYVG